MFIIKNQQNYKLIPEINSKELRDVTEIGNDGNMNLGTFTAKLGDRNVFLKIAGRMGAKEGLWMLYLNRLGLGVKFYGVVKIGTEYALVMENVQGTNLKAWMGKKPINEDFKITKAMIAEMHRQTRVLYQAGLFNNDPQFLISPEKITLIDTFQVSSIKAFWKVQSLQQALADVDGQIEIWRSLGRVEE